MPREQRKRGKKHKKSDNTNDRAAQNDYPEPEPVPAPEPAGPSWIKPAPVREHAPDIDAPFGLVDPDVKAYFRNVDTQMRDWAEHAPDAPEDAADGDGADVRDPNEGTRCPCAVAVAALTRV
jgi:nucleolar protein 9